MDGDGTIDFSWFMFIGMTKLKFTRKECGRLTLTLFNKLYQHYKDNFDLELRMYQSGTTYANLKERQRQEEEWF